MKAKQPCLLMFYLCFLGGESHCFHELLHLVSLLQRVAQHILGADEPVLQPDHL